MKKIKKQKYYVIWAGWKTGIFDNWQNCQQQTTGFKGAKFKAFDSKQEAKEAFNNHYFNYIGKSSGITPSKWAPGLYGVAVDAACSGNPGIMQYRGVDLKMNKQVFIQGPFSRATNNIGEFLAVVQALVLFKDEDVPIYTDSRSALAWVKAKKIKTTLEQVTANSQLFELIHRAEIWLEKNTFNNPVLKWDTKRWGEIPADFGRK